jgi:hypothetical protein
MADNPNLQMRYNNTIISPIPNMTYNTEVLYNNDTAHGMKYKITLNGYIMANDFVGGISEGITYINNVFSSNGHLLQIDSFYANGASAPVFLSNNILVRNISFQETDNNWTRYAKYTIELESMNTITGEDLSNLLKSMDVGQLNYGILSNLDSPNMLNTGEHAVQEWNEQFDLQTGDNQIQRTTVVEKRFDYDIPLENVPVSIVTTLGGEYFTISYSVKATGKQHTYKDQQGNKIMLPAWEHAKRFVHKKLLQQMGGLFNTFLSMNGNVIRENIGANNGNGALSSISNNSDVSYPSFGLYNENVSFEVSESDGEFSATYNAIIKRDCPVDDVGGNTNSEYIAFCKDSVLHNVSKSVNQVYEANEENSSVNRLTTITVNGEIQGLVPGGIFNPGSRIHINNLTTGSFLCYNSTSQYPQIGNQGGYDKSYYANFAFDHIFDYNRYDLKPQFKELLGVTAYALSVSPTATLAPSTMNLTRDLINGKVTYSATYDTKYNCDPNNFEINVSTNEAVPVVAEFVVPNNNIKDLNGVLCDNGKGYVVMQLLGTYTPKTIDVSIKANVGSDFNKCCLGTSANWNLLDYNFIQLESFILPSGMNIPYIGENYALTKKTKSVSYPKGDMNFSLSYVCSDFCEIDDYFTSKNIPVNDAKIKYSPTSESSDETDAPNE